MQQIVQLLGRALPLRWANFLVSLGLLLGCALGAQAQVVGGTTYTIGTGQTYTTVAAAITALNGGVTGTGTVTFNIGLSGSSNYSETFALPTTGRIAVPTNPPTSAKPVIFQKNPANTGAKPVIIAGVGTSTTIDAIISLGGSDYVTFDGISLLDPTTNNSATKAMEFGFLLGRAGAGATLDGCNNNTIRNCTVTLQRIYTNNSNNTPTGIFSTNGTVAVPNTALSATSAPAGGQSSSNAFQSNIIQNVCSGVYLLGVSDAFLDQSNSVGSATSGTGNTIQNYGGAGTQAYGIRAQFQNSAVFSYNTLDNANAAAGGVASASTLYGIYHQATVNSSFTASNNTITLSQAANGSQVSGIKNDNTGTGTFTANSNIFSLSIPNSNTGSHIMVYNAGAVASMTANSNSFSFVTGGTSSISATYNAIFNTSQLGSLTINNNTFNNTGNTVGTQGLIVFISNNSTTPDGTISGNMFTNLTRSGGGSGATYGYSNTASPTSGTMTISGNTISNITVAGASTGAVLYGLYTNSTSSGQAQVWTGNTISNLTNASAYAIAGIYCNGGAAGSQISGNTISGISTAATSTSVADYGLWLGANLAGGDVFQNTISGISGPSSSQNVTGMRVDGGTLNIYRNKIYDISASGTAGKVYGVNINGGTQTFYNNYIGDLRSPAATANQAVNGLYISGGTAVSAYYNTIYQSTNGGGGTSYSVNGIYASTTPTVELRNNLVVITSTAGTGGDPSAAYRRSDATLTTYASTSNNNLFYCGTPGTKQAIYYDGTTVYPDLTSYKALVATRDANSVTELPPFLNTTTSSAANYLHINPNTATLVESGGADIGAVANDYDGDARGPYTGSSAPYSVNGVAQTKGGGTAPDIGADEGDFTPVPPAPDVKPTALAAPVSGAVCRSATETVTVTVQNSGTVALNFGTATLTVTVTVTKPDLTTQTFTQTVMSGPLAIGATTNVVVSTALDMTTTGTYSFAVTATVAGDANTGNDNLATQTRTVAAPTVGTASATPVSFCATNGAAPVLAVASFANGSLQWQVSSSGMAGSFTNIPGGSTNNFTAPTINATTYYQAVVSCGAASITSNLVTVTAGSPTVGTASVTPTGTFCIGTPVTPVLSLNSFTNGNLQWQVSSTGLAGSFGNLTGGTTNPFTAPAVTATTYYQAVVSCGAASATSNVVSVVASDPAITGTNSPVSRCGPGTVTLTATANAGTTISWYDTNAATTALATGSPYSPSVTATRQFFVEGTTGGLTESAGRMAPDPATMTTNSSNSSGVVFDALVALTLKSVTIYPTTTGPTSLMVRLVNSAGTQLTSVTTSVPGVAAGTSPVVVTLNFNVPAGTGYRLLTGTSNSVSMERESGATFPIPSPSNLLTVTSGYNSNSTNGTYYYFYNLVVQTPTCTSARLPVNVVVNPLPTATLTSPAMCAGNASTVSVAFPVGTAPFTFNYTIDGTPQTQVVTSSNPYVITTPVLTIATTYALTSLDDANCSATAAAIAAATITITPNTTTTFTGAVNSDWTNAGNWTNCVPTALIDAIVPTGKTATLASAAANAKDLTIQGTGTVTLTTATASLALKGNLTTASVASFTDAAGTTVFDGSSAQNVAAGTFYNLTLSGTAAKVLSGAISVGSTLDLTSGLLTQGNFGVRLTGTASSISGAGSGHLLVQNGTGRLRIDNIGTGAGTRASAFFPIGTSGAAGGYTPVTLTNSGTTDDFTASVADGIAPSPTPNPNIAPNTHYVNKTWDISEGTTGGSNASMALQWNAANEATPFNHGLVDIVHYVGSKWEQTCITCYSPAVGSGPYSVTRTGYTSFSPFAVQDDVKPLPVELTRFVATREGHDAVLDWNTASEKNSAGFEVQAALDGRQFRKLGFVPSVAGRGSSAPQAYSFRDQEAGKTGLRYYRLRQLDADGSESFSPVRAVDFGAEASGLTVAPNPFGSHLVLTVTRTTAATAYLTLTDATGRTVRQQPVSLDAGRTLVELSALDELPAGLYLLNLSSNGQVQHLKVVKL